MKLRPLRKTHGGKQYLADWIISLFPPEYEQLSYHEVFGGGASVLLRKKPSLIGERLNDIDPDTFSIYDGIKNYPEWVVASLSNIPYCQETFDKALKLMYHPILNNIILTRMSRGGFCKNLSKSSRLRGGQNEGLNAFKTFIQQIPELSRRMSNVKISNSDYGTELMTKAYDLIYLDPPYLPETRTAKKCYEYEMSLADHQNLLDIITRDDMRAKILISGYDSDLYNTKLAGWNKFTKSVANNSGQGKTKQKRMECVWRNY